MATLTGISGMLGGFGDGNGGSIALSLREKVLRFLKSDTLFTYMVSTMKPDSWGAGSVYFRKIQTLQNETYKGSNNSFQEPQSTTVRIDINQAQVVKYSYELFNMDRVKSADELLGQIAATMYESMSQQLNAALLLFLKYHTLGDAAEIKKVYTTLSDSYMPQAAGQFVKLSALGQTMTSTGSTTTAQFGNNVFLDYMKIRNGVDRLGQLYTKESFGVPTPDFQSVISPIGRNSLSYMGRDQVGGTISNFQIQKVQGTDIAGFKFFVDKMLDMKLAVGQSFNRDYDVDLKNVFGFLLHNEAVAMPIGRIYAWSDTNPNDGNYLFGLRWMYGIGFLRPQLVCALIKDGAQINVNSSFITGGTNPVNITFNGSKTEIDFENVNNWPHQSNPVSYQQPAFITNPTPSTPSTTNTPTGNAQPVTVTPGGRAVIKDTE